MSIATFEDVQDRFYRELDAEDRKLVETRLHDAEVKIRRKIPDLDYRMEEEPTLLDTVISVCCEAVIRLIRNPEGFVQETDGGYSYMRDQGGSSDNKLTITREEWADLGIKKKIAVIHMNPMRGAGI